MRIAAIIAIVAAMTIGVLGLVRGNGADDEGPLVVELRIEERYGLGEPISMVFGVENMLSETLTLVYGPDPPYGVEVVYAEGGGDVIFGAWSFAPSASPDVTVTELRSGGKIEYRASWNQIDESSGDQVPPGRYRVRASHWGRCEPYDCLVSDYASVEIVP